MKCKHCGANIFYRGGWRDENQAIEAIEKGRDDLPAACVMVPVHEPAIEQGQRVYFGELVDDDKYEWMSRHLRLDVAAENFEEAMRKLNEQKPNDKFYVVQVCRIFDDCTRPQPIFDIMNGFYGSFFDSEATWKSAMSWTSIKRA